MSSRRIKSLNRYPQMEVIDCLSGKAQIRFMGEKLSVTVELDEYYMRDIARQLRRAFNTIRTARWNMNDHNFKSLKENE